jgi:hypothetical protein
MHNRRPPSNEPSRGAWLETGLAALAFPGLLAAPRITETCRKPEHAADALNRTSLW